jgi:hypothetical protein
MARHARDSYYVVGEGLLAFDPSGNPVVRQPSAAAEPRMFRFSRLGPVGQQTDPAIIAALAKAMTSPPTQPDSEPGIPAGFTYLGQFLDHDLTQDRTAVALGQDVTVDELVDGRTPALDLDSLYGRGPKNKDDRRFFAADGVKLLTGTTAAVPIDDGTNRNLDGFDLPRVGGATGTKADQRAPLIPDGRNDENLAIAQTHLAFIHFHNRVVDRLVSEGVPSVLLFERAYGEVVRHYHWLIKTDFLPRVVDPEIVDEVFTHGRHSFDVPETEDASDRPDHRPTMPIEFAIAAYRLGHSMVRGAYQWNRLFNTNGKLRIATLFQLFTFTGTSGILTPTQNPADLDDPEGGTFLHLPTNWIVDFRRIHDFTVIPNRPDLAPPAPGLNVTKRIDTLLVDPLATLPEGTFGGRSQGLAGDAIQRNLAFRNMTRANMVRLASGQQMADLLDVKPLTPDEIITGNQGADLSALTQDQKDALTAATPLWFYILREAEVNGNGKLTGVGGRIVAEVFHRTMEASTVSILREPHWRPRFGQEPGVFRMVDLLLFASNGQLDQLNPLGDA